jgi:hypothetical protein
MTGSISGEGAEVSSVMPPILAKRHAAREPDRPDDPAACVVSP